MDIIEGNKLIAKFMGFSIENIKGTEIMFPPINSYYKLNTQHTFCGENISPTSDRLLFHKSWDWLMPVLEKIEVTNRVGMRENKCEIFLSETETTGLFERASKIDALWEAIVNFLEKTNEKDNEEILSV